MKTHVIIIEDDEAINDILDIIIQNDGYKVEAFNAATPFYNWQYDTPDLFIIDKNLGDANGIELCKFLKSQVATANVPVIIISATPGIVPLARAAGANACLPKPFSRAELLELVHQLAGKPD